MKKLAPFLALLALAGCIDLEQEFTLNPDGSGKVVVRWVGSPIEINAEKSAEARAKNLLKAEVTQCEGVDAWQDVSCVARDDGKFEFKGTAYFKDLAKLKLHNSGVTLIALKLSKDAAGNLVIDTEPDKKEETPAKPLSDEEAKKKLKEERAQYQQGKILIESMAAHLKVSSKVNLPGRVGASAIFKKEGDASVRFTLEGKTVLKALNELIMDDEWMLKHLKTHGGLQGGMPNGEAVNEKIFGDKGPIRAVTAGELKPRFDYEAEAGPARKAWESTAAQLNAVPPLPPSAKGGDFKSLKLTAVRHVLEKESDRGLSNEDPGLTLTFTGELPGSVLRIKQGKATKAVADTGASLLPSGSRHPVTGVQLSTDKTVVSFDVDLQLPPAGAKGLKEVSGSLTYIVGGKTKEVDLGFTELKEGAAGKDAQITKIDATWEEGHERLQVSLSMSNDRIESVIVKGESGALLKTTAAGWSSWGDECSRTLSLKGKFPPKGRILVNLYEDLKEYEIPFKVENVDLLGRPLK